MISMYFMAFLRVPGPFGPSHPTVERGTAESTQPATMAQHLVVVIKDPGLGYVDDRGHNPCGTAGGRRDVGVVRRDQWVRRAARVGLRVRRLPRAGRRARPPGAARAQAGDRG